MDDKHSRRPDWMHVLLALAGLGVIAGLCLAAGLAGTLPRLALAVPILALFAGILAAALAADRQRRGTERDLRARLDALTLENEEQRVFIHAATHDLHEPLRKIQTFGERLRDRMGLLPDPTSAQYLDRMTDGATRMRTLLDTLLAHVRVNDRNTRHETVDLDAVVRSVLTHFGDELDAIGADISVDGLLPVEADPGQMTMIFTNIVGNALKYRRPDAKLAIGISAREERGPGGEVLVIDISDNGIGFDPRHADRIFGLFERLHSRSDYPGSGVGLATCRKIAHRHGGSLQARAENGKGACFTLILPRQQVNLASNDTRERVNTTRAPS